MSDIAMHNLCTLVWYWSVALKQFGLNTLHFVTQPVLCPISEANVRYLKIWHLSQFSRDHLWSKRNEMLEIRLRGNNWIHENFNWTAAKSLGSRKATTVLLTIAGGIQNRDLFFLMSKKTTTSRPIIWSVAIFCVHNQRKKLSNASIFGNYRVKNDPYAISLS